MHCRWKFRRLDRRTRILSSRDLAFRKTLNTLECSRGLHLEDLSEATLCVRDVLWCHCEERGKHRTKSNNTGSSRTLLCLSCHSFHISRRFCGSLRWPARSTNSDCQYECLLTKRRERSQCVKRSLWEFRSSFLRTFAGLLVCNRVSQEPALDKRICSYTQSGLLVREDSAKRSWYPWYTREEISLISI